eukprot:359432-Prorocentrum_minimum.AAC.1
MAFNKVLTTKKNGAPGTKAAQVLAKQVVSAYSPIPAAERPVQKQLKKARQAATAAAAARADLLPTGMGCSNMGYELEDSLTSYEPKIRLTTNSPA